MENLSAYLDGELSEADKQAFEQHIQQCETCAGELAVMKTILSSCSELEEDLPAGFETSLHKRLEAAKEEAAAKKNQLVRIRLFSQIAAGFVLVIALGLVVRSGLFTQKTSDAAPQAPMMTAGSAAGQMASSEATNNAGDPVPEQASEPTGVQVERAATTTMKSATAPASPDLMTDSGALKAEEKVVMVPDEGIYSLEFTEAMDRLEGYDTLIRIQAADITKALDSIMAIEKKLENGEDINCENLESTKQKYSGTMEQPVEVKLYYSNDELWQQFLAEMQGAFPDMVVESVAALEEQEYIRVVLQKVE
jgi:hypothetical protein